MRKQKLFIVSGLILGILSLVVSTSFAASKPTTVNVTELSTLQAMVSGIKTPAIESPQWLKDQDATAALPFTGTVTYSVTTKGTVTADMAEFAQQANSTLNDARGWARLGVRFHQVASGGSFTLVMSEASQVPSFSSGCSAEYSCRAGRYVIINQDRWLGATPSWNGAGGSLRDYRHMVVNHETGHWLGHDHQSCGGAGQSAPVMQQQSIDLQGCTFNPWPLASELWSTQLGISKR